MNTSVSRHGALGAVGRTDAEMVRQGGASPHARWAVQRRLAKPKQAGKKLGLMRERKCALQKHVLQGTSYQAAPGKQGRRAGGAARHGGCPEGRVLHSMSAKCAMLHARCHRASAGANCPTQQGGTPKAREQRSACIGMANGRYGKCKCTVCRQRQTTNGGCRNYVHSGLILCCASKCPKHAFTTHPPMPRSGPRSQHPKSHPHHRISHLPLQRLAGCSKHRAPTALLRSLSFALSLSLAGAGAASVPQLRPDAARCAARPQGGAPLPSHRCEPRMGGGE